ncbi:NlpC/P60 family protein [Sandarakinorhabdus oryzae]|uniref:NlpC/P60 family protein n=1 Tax=Sandarakinorhabdus oryzae TaxID=2675220 RepID=UPI0012E1509D|nr:TIGR02594 family protein [Sandarakinorhabdus oryzae]
MTTLELQKALKARGFDPGDIDGAMGRNTIAAIRAFQASVGLDVDGVAGPDTLGKLGASEVKAAADPLSSLSTPWFTEAQRAIGVHEDTSPASNPLIIGWAKRLRIAYNNDETPWCGLFVAHCIGLTLPGEPLPINPLGARNWSQFGVACTPQPGAVMTFWRESRASGKGHVGFYVGEDASAFHILGGNQGDAVNVKRFPRDRFLVARWPKTAPPPTGGPRRLQADGSFSTNEQ